MSKPKIADKFPKAIEMEQGIYYWYTCGKSANQPFCDGSHKGSEFSPKLVKAKEKKPFIGVCVNKQKIHLFVMEQINFFKCNIFFVSFF